MQGNDPPQMADGVPVAKRMMIAITFTWQLLKGATERSQGQHTRAFCSRRSSFRLTARLICHNES